MFVHDLKTSSLLISADDLKDNKRHFYPLEQITLGTLEVKHVHHIQDSFQDPHFH